MKILVPIDGSENSLRALRHLIGQHQEFGTAIDLHVLNVQPPIASGAVKMFVNEDQLRQYYQDEAMQQLQAARKMLDDAGVAYHHHIVVGEVATTIARFAQEQHCAQIVMGTRGLSAVSGAILGSVSTKVIQLAEMPVLLVK
jgi:nucleotide-binding universal stress UspA family protein